MSSEAMQREPRQLLGLGALVLLAPYTQEFGVILR
jgi:hypothetical protein